MKYKLYLVSILLSLLLLPSAGFSQEDSSDETSVIEQTTEIEDDGLPGMEEITKRKAFAQLRKMEIANEEDERGMWLAYVMPFAAFGFVLTLLSIIFGFERKKDRNRHDTIRVYLEKGLEVPPELLVDKDNPKTWKPTSDIRKGVIWFTVGLGISLTVFIFAMSSRGAALGLIPMFIGIAYFIAAKLDPKPSQQEA